jgi:miniconductance mechanosensitive channel
MNNSLTAWLHEMNISGTTAVFLEMLLGFALLLAVVGLAAWLSSRFLVPLLARTVRSSHPALNDVFILKSFFGRLSRLLPIAVIYAVVDLLFPADGAAAELLKRLALILFVVGAAWVLDAALQTIYEIVKKNQAFRDKPIRGYIDGAQIVLYILAAVLAVSFLTGQSPLGIFTVLGGLTAVLLLIFKDTILGFVANMRLSSNDMVRVGDWIEMPNHDADGDVIDVSIHTVKVQNWDRTITTIPTHVLISDHFKNWRGMQESGGRRIKRALHIDMSSIKFCTPEMLDRFARISVIADYLRARQEEIEAHNRTHGLDSSQTVNGRRQSNIGVFRAYCQAYLRAHPGIHQEMILMVRQLNPTPQGLPLEIYAFTNDIAWVNYEGIQADIFDHLLAAAGHFDLRLFQTPSGHDLQSLTAGLPGRQAEPLPLRPTGPRKAVQLTTGIGE